MQITSEAVQRWTRVALYYLWGGLASYGITVGDNWKAIVGSILGFIGTAVWTKYGSSLNAMLTEVGKVDGVEKVVVQANPDKVSTSDINISTPENVHASPSPVK